jgi:lysophospholipase L1-like esterase
MGLISRSGRGALALLPFTLSLLAFGCARATGVADGGAPADAPLAALDAVAPDVSAAPDAAEDAGAAPDAADVAADAAVAPDARAPDADVSDLGVDPGPVDAGVWPDAGPRTIAERCFAGLNTQTPTSGPDYDQFMPVVGSHCYGTNHQDIQGVERVVFLGDSVTAGTPPTVSGDYYRNQLTDLLVARFGLQAPRLGWRTVNPTSGVSYDRESGDFANCARWGARTDDLNGPRNQLEQCFPPDQLGKRTLVVMTMGGNDIAHLTKQGAASRMPPRTPQELRQITQDFVQLLRDAIVWLKAPGRFPNGVYVIFANPPEFTDGTGDIESCGLSSVAGFDDPWADPAALQALVVWALEQYMAIAVDTQTDLLWFLETFCGHGFVATGPNADPNNRCYRGPNTERWFDLTCTHPNPTGHGELARMFMAIVDE